MQTIEIHGFPQSTYVRTARMACEEKGVAYALHPLEFRSESHRALHPFLRMPVMRAGELVLYETLAITSYVDEAFQGPPLVPAEPPQRARNLQWISACNDYLFGDLVRALFHSERPDEEQISLARRDLEVFDRALGGRDFLLGEEPWLCDYFLAPMTAFAEERGEKLGLLDGLDALAGWMRRVGGRSSFRATQP